MHITNTCKQTVSTENGHREHQQAPKTSCLTLSGPFLFISLMALKPWCPLSLFQAWLSYMLMDLTFAETESCQYNDFTGPAGCTMSQGDKNLKKKTCPGPPLCCQTAAVRQLKLDLDSMHNMTGSHRTPLFTPNDIGIGTV